MIDATSLKKKVFPVPTSCIIDLDATCKNHFLERSHWKILPMAGGTDGEHKSIV